jgi:hypothetical protein
LVVSDDNLWRSLCKEKESAPPPSDEMGSSLPPPSDEKGSSPPPPSSEEESAPLQGDEPRKTKRGSLFGSIFRKPEISATSKPERRKSLQLAPASQSSHNIGSRSILNHVTGSEDIYESELFSSRSRLTFKRPNLEWERRLADSLTQVETGFASAEETISVQLPEFLMEWDAALERRSIAKQYLA